jgi:hypothetical protein
MEFPREKEQFTESSDDFGVLVGRIVPWSVPGENREVLDHSNVFTLSYPEEGGGVLWV